MVLIQDSWQTQGQCCLYSSWGSWHACWEKMKAHAFHDIHAEMQSFHCPHEFSLHGSLFYCRDCLVNLLLHFPSAEQESKGEYLSWLLGNQNVGNEIFWLNIKAEFGLKTHRKICSFGFVYSFYLNIAMTWLLVRGTNMDWQNSRSTMQYFAYK